MMPMCQGIGCDKTATFLGPNENPSYCDEHLAMLMDRIGEYVERTRSPLDPKPNADYQIENAEIEGLLNDIGKSLGKKMPKGWGFNLLIFSFGKGGSMFYISNAQRSDMLKAMKEFINKQKGKK